MNQFAKALAQPKLTLAIFGTSLLVLLLAGAANLVYESLRLRHRLTREATALAETTGATSVAALATGDAKTAAKILGMLQARREVVFAGLYTRSGELLAQYSSGDRRPPPAIDILTSAKNRRDGDELTVVVPVFLNQDTVGAVSLRENTSNEQAQFNAYLSVTIPIMAGVLVLAFFLSIWVQPGLDEDIPVNKRTEFRMLVHGMQSTAQPICITDLEDRFIFVNRAFQATYGYSEREILGKTPGILFSPNNPPPLLQEIRKHTRRGGWRGEVLDRRKDGVEFPVYLTTSEIKDPDGEIIARMGVMEVITERRRAESQIRLLASAVESTEEMISITDSDGRFEFVNSAFLKQYGHSSEEVLGNTPESLQMGGSPGATPEQFRQANMDGGWRCELENRRKDGSKFPISLSISAIKDSYGKTTGHVRVARDISAIKIAEQRNAAFSALASALSGCTTQISAARVILANAAELFGWDAAGVHLCEPEQIVASLKLAIIAGKTTEVLDESVRVCPAPLTRLLLEKGAQLINSQGRSQVHDELLQFFGDFARPTPSIMLVPVRIGNQVIGVLCVQSATPDKYSPHDLQIFQALATYCGSALRRLRAQEALRHSEERFRTLFESAPIAIALHDAEGHFIEANRSYQTLLGYSAEELQKLGVVHVTCPEDVPEGRGLWGELVASTRERYAREKRLLRKDGTQVWIDAFTSAVRDANGRLLYVVSMVEDITERKRSQAAVQELAWIVENSDHAIFSNTLQGVISSWNKAAERIYGYTIQEVLGQPISMLVPPDRIEELENVMNRLRAGAHMREFDTIHRRKDNTLVELSLTISPVLDPQGKLIAASVLARDITQRKRLEQEVLQISSEERRNVGHELHDGLGQVLTGIALKAKALQCKLAKSASPCVLEVEEIVTLINGAIGQTRHLAHGLDPVEIEASGLVTALKNLAAEMRKVFDVECEIICNDEVLPVNAVTGFALYRITQEAIHNATRHGLARQIKIELSRRSQRLLLKISDDGKGFVPGTVERKGMGLRIMQHRAHSIGGVLTVSSHPRQGATIECSVPLALCRTRELPKGAGTETN